MKLISLFFVLLCVYSSLGFTWNLESASNYNPSSAFPAPRYYHGAAGVKDVLVVAGGVYWIDDGTQQVYPSDTWWFNTTSHQWLLERTDLFQRSYYALNYRTEFDELRLFGGYSVDSSGYIHYFNDVWSYVLGSNFWVQDQVNDLSTYDALLLTRINHAATTLNDKLYVFGGHVANFGYSFNDLYVYDILTDDWTLLVPDIFLTPNPSRIQPYGRVSATLNAYVDPVWGDSLLLFGGFREGFGNPQNAGFNDTWQFIISTNTWVQIQTTTVPPLRYGHTSAVIGNQLIIYAGVASFPGNDVYYGDVWTLNLSGGGVAEWVQVLGPETGPGPRQGVKGDLVNGVFYITGGYHVEVGVWAGLENDVWSLRS